jgi:hypothetical protein
MKHAPQILRADFLMVVTLGMFSAHAAAEQSGPNGLISYLAYNSTTKACTQPAAISYQLPDPNVFPGPTYPVFTYLPGTYENAINPTANQFTSGMAKLGFLAASIGYDAHYLPDGCTQTPTGHGGYIEKTQCIYDTPHNPNSAVAALCKLPQANCGSGIVVAGISQGASLAVLSANYSPQVKAVYALSTSDDAEQLKIPGPCLQGTQIAAQDKLVLINGASDLNFNNQNDIEGVVTLHQCAPGTTQCGTNTGTGAGWYIVQNDQVETGFAGHCYFMEGIPSPNFLINCLASTFDPTWQNGSENWSLNPNLQWLASFGTERHFSRDGK